MFLEDAKKLFYSETIDEKATKNCVSICGTIIEEPTYSHSCREKVFFTTTICIRRKKESRNKDFVKLLIPEEVLKSAGNLKGEYVNVEGNLKTYRGKRQDGEAKRKEVEILKVNVFVKKINKLEKSEETNIKNNNLIFLDGYVCKEPYYHITETNKYEITTLMVSVHRKKASISDHISCIAWDDKAKKLKNVKLGNRIRLLGRLQSREYEKMGHKYVTYEVSIFEVKAIK